MPFDIDTVRAAFPAMALSDDGRPRAYLDNPAGTQVPQCVIDAVSDCLLLANANLGGFFTTTRAAGEIVDEAHAAMRDFLNARDAGEIIYGQNSTSLVLHISRSIGRELAAGDEIVLTRMDHDANVGPWLMLAADRGVTVKWWDFDATTWELDLARLDALLSPRTRLVCVNHASNALGTLTDVAEVTRRAHAAGAMVFVDAVQSAPHLPIDVQAIGCDFLVCSPYKFYGPHQGVLYGRREHLERMTAYRVRPAGDELPHKYETGTLSHESMAGTAAAVEHFAWLGRTMGGAAQAGRREAIVAGYRAVHAHEDALTRRLLDGLAGFSGLQVLGITDPARAARRVPTVSFVWDRHAPADIARAMAAQNIFVWSGHNYALEIYRTLGREATGGLRVGFAQYNTAAEVDRVLEVLDGMR
jgi:cysteine desulfurase family protein (TIGR01976 family)